MAGQIDHLTGQRPAEARGRWVYSHVQQGVLVLRCFVPSVYSAGFFGRAIGFLVFIFSATWAALLLAPRPDVVIATSPPLIVAVPGILCAWLRRVPLVFEVRDLWPESAVTTGVLSKKSPLTWMLYRLEALAYRAARRIVVLTPAFQKDIERRRLAGPERLRRVTNGVDLDQFQPGSRENSERQQLGWGNCFVALYAGAHGLANHLVQLLDAAERLRDREDILLVTVGEGPERASLEAEAKRRGLDRFQFLGPIPKERMPDIIRAADAGIAVLKKVDTFKTVYPNKVFDYMACARPVVLGIDGIARELVVDQAGAGLYAEPESGAELAGQIRRLADDPQLRSRLGENGRAYVSEHFSRSRLAETYVQILEECSPKRMERQRGEP